MVFVYVLHELDLLLLHLRKLSSVLVLLLAQLHHCLSLFCVDTCQFFLPKMHILVLSSLGLLCHFLPLLLLTGQEVPLHLLDSAVVFVGLLLELPGIIELNQVYGLLDILKLFLVGESDLLVAPAEFIDPLDFLGVVFIFPLVDLVDIDLLLDGFLGELLIFLDAIFFLLELLSKQLDPILHGLHMFPLSFDLVLLVSEGNLRVYLQGTTH